MSDDARFKLPHFHREVAVGRPIRVQFPDGWRVGVVTARHIDGGASVRFPGDRVLLIPRLAVLAGGVEVRRGWRRPRPAPRPPGLFDAEVEGST